MQRKFDTTRAATAVQDDVCEMAQGQPTMPLLLTALVC
jgi:hypothetical protein